jgi:predicted nucleotide-binding protein
MASHQEIMTMEKPKLFIVPTPKADVLAEKLRDALGGVCDATLAKHERERKPSSTMIEMLLDATKKYDFAVILLTEADLVPRKASEYLDPRACDNCWFEAGLFVAALQRERCFIAASRNIQLDKLPESLRGVIVHTFDEPDDLTMREQCMAAIQPISAVIKDDVETKGPRVKKTVTFELISQEQLILKERLRREKGDLDEGNVVVASIQPAETEYAPAAQVRLNMKEGVDYVYFFHANLDGAQKIAKLLQMLLLADKINADDARSQRARQTTIRERRQEILTDLREMCKQRSLSIYFLPNEPSLQFCIHNANSVYEAVAYIKRGTFFIDLGMKGEQSNGLWRDMQRNIPLGSETRGIFHSTTSFDVEEEPFRSKFSDIIERYFPDIGDQVTTLCFEGIPKQG